MPNRAAGTPAHRTEQQRGYAVTELDQGPVFLHRHTLTRYSLHFSLVGVTFTIHLSAGEVGQLEDLLSVAAMIQARKDDA